jgi:pseudaminic acid biosynthesis-associated methylase
VRQSNGDYVTKQEQLWAGEFGDAYTDRNQGEALVAANTALFARVLARAGEVRSILEFGANRGLNLQAIRQLLPTARLAAVEINPKAVESLRALGDVEIFATSVLEFEPTATADLVLSKGLLIHISPGALPEVYDRLYRSAARYICLAEYYNPTPVEVAYRGQSGVLFKRDFAGEMLDRFGDLRLADYGFVYHRDPQFPQDDLTWFLLAKRS